MLENQNELPMPKETLYFQTAQDVLFSQHSY